MSVVRWLLTRLMVYVIAAEVAAGLFLIWAIFYMLITGQPI